jgi:hypothetical protein
MKQNIGCIKDNMRLFGGGLGRPPPEVMNIDKELHRLLTLAAKNYMHVHAHKQTCYWLHLLMVDNTGQNM